MSSILGQTAGVREYIDALSEGHNRNSLDLGSAKSLSSSRSRQVPYELEDSDSTRDDQLPPSSELPGTDGGVKRKCDLLSPSGTSRDSTDEAHSKPVPDKEAIQAHRTTKRRRLSGSSGSKRRYRGRIPANPPGRSFIATVPVTVHSPSYSPRKLLTNSSTDCLNLGQLQHIKATFSYTLYCFDEGEFESDKLPLLLGYIQATTASLRYPGDDVVPRAERITEGRECASWISRHPPWRRRWCLADQFHDVGDVYKRFDASKAEIGHPDQKEYNYLLGCMEQLIHRCRGLRYRLEREGELGDGELHPGAEFLAGKQKGEC